jgi:predicted regulator of Ras-like GTPase activity (Roadblock/LC7/MglB family)
MSAPMLAWTLSAAGALLFFTAGMLYALRRGEARAIPEAREPRASGIHLRVGEPGAERARRDVAKLLEDLRGADNTESEARPGNLLRAILEQETRGCDYTGAVIADELGLVVASTGEYGDALAAYGAFLAGVGAKTGDALPLHELRQVVVQDEHDMTLTVRPIATADDNFALVTLTMNQHELPLRASTASGR